MPPARPSATAGRAPRARPVNGSVDETLALFTARDAEMDFDGVLRVVADADGRVARVLLWQRPLAGLLIGIERRARRSARG